LLFSETAVCKPVNSDGSYVCMACIPPISSYHHLTQLSHTIDVNDHFCDKVQK